MDIDRMKTRSLQLGGALPGLYKTLAEESQKHEERKKRLADLAAEVNALPGRAENLDLDDSKGAALLAAELGRRSGELEISKRLFERSEAKVNGLAKAFEEAAQARESDLLKTHEAQALQIAADDLQGALERLARCAKRLDEISASLPIKSPSIMGQLAFIEAVRKIVAAKLGESFRWTNSTGDRDRELSSNYLVALEALNRLADYQAEGVAAAMIFGICDIMLTPQALGVIPKVR